MVIPLLTLFAALFSSVEGLQVEDADTQFTTCVYMKNEQSHFTVRIKAGTPDQYFDLIADTGSSDVIIAACRCQKLGNCNKGDKCFRAKDSSTFQVERTTDGELPGVVLGFGSGEIAAVQISDQAAIGSLSQFMDDGIMDMVDHRLDFDGPFEGIFALGLPGTSSYVTDSGEKKYGGATFFERANQGRFSICMFLGAHGILRIGTEAAENTLGTIGSSHWALDMFGLSAGDADHEEETPTGYCTVKEDPTADAACGGIPDSGTTAIMGPSNMVDGLVSMMCDKWQRCRENHNKYSDKVEAFQMILYDCWKWKDTNGGYGLTELPPIHFFLQNDDATRSEKISVYGPDYVMVAEADSALSVMGLLGGSALPPMTNRLDTEPVNSEDNCFLAMGEFDYNTAKAGPAWILGLPIFFNYRISYDGSTSPAGVAFSNARPCGECPAKPVPQSHNAAKISLNAKVSSSNSTAPQKIKTGAQREWRMNVAPRMPSIDTSRGFL